MLGKSHLKPGFPTMLKNFIFDRTLCPVLELSGNSLCDPRTIMFGDPWSRTTKVYTTHYGAATFRDFFDTSKKKNFYTSKVMRCSGSQVRKSQEMDRCTQA